MAMEVRCPKCNSPRVTKADGDVCVSGQFIDTNAICLNCGFLGVAEYRMTKLREKEEQE